MDIHVFTPIDSLPKHPQQEHKHNSSFPCECQETSRRDGCTARIQVSVPRWYASALAHLLTTRQDACPVLLFLNNTKAEASSDEKTLYYI